MATNMARQWDEMLRRSFHPSQWFSEDRPTDHERERDQTEEGRIMYVYRKLGNGFSVGYYDPHGEWIAESFHDVREHAAERVHWLNGGGRRASARTGVLMTQPQTVGAEGV